MENILAKAKERAARASSKLVDEPMTQVYTKTLTPEISFCFWIIATDTIFNVETSGTCSENQWKRILPKS